MTRRTGAALGLLLVITAAAYLPSVDGAFLFDDEPMVASPWVRVLGTYTSLDGWRQVVRPVTSLTFALNHAAVGFDTRGWHLTSIAIHLAAVLLAWAVARRVLARAGLASPAWPALAAAAVFALHPLQTEAVSYLSQRAESLAAALWLAGFLLLAASDEAAPHRRGWLVGGAAALHLVGLGAKPTAATLPMAWLLLAAALPPAAERATPLARRLASRLPAAAPLLALSLLAAAGGLASARGSSHAGFDLPGVPFHLHLATQLRAIPTYLAAIAWPSGQTADPQFPFSASFLEAGVVAGGALLALLAAASAWALRRFQGEGGDGAAAGRTAAFGFLLFLVILSPTIVVPLRDPFAEHRAYLAILAAAIAAAAAAAAVAAALRRAKPAPARIAMAGAVALLALLAWATAARNRVWQDEIALWTDAVAKAPGKARPHANLAVALNRVGRLEEAVREYDRALELRDRTLPRVRLVRGVSLAFIRLGRLDEARQRLVAFLALKRDPLALATLGKVELKAGRIELAERLAREAVGLDPKEPRVQELLGEVRERLGDRAGAREAFAEAVRLEPDAGILYRLGRAEENLGRLAEACAAYARSAANPVGGETGQRARVELARLRCR